MSELIYKGDVLGVISCFFKDNDIDGLADLEREINRLDSFSPWHRVEDELPDDGEWAIFTNGKVVTVERFKVDAYNHFFPASQWFNFEDAIAWMPLPEPPKEVQE